MPAKRKLPTDEILMDLFNNKKVNQTEIAEIYKVQLPAVHKHLLKLGVLKPNQKMNKFSHHIKLTDPELIKQYSIEGKTAEELSLVCGINKINVYPHLKRLGIFVPIKAINRKRYVGKYRKGYPYKYVPKNSRSFKRGLVPIHLLVMEEHIGRPVAKNEVVHHIDLDRGNYNIENLCLCKNKSEHGKLHWQIQRLIKQLMSMGLVSFDPKKGYYIPQQKLWGEHKNR